MTLQSISENLANLRGSSIALSNVNRKLKTTFQPSIRARLSKAIFDVVDVFDASEG